MIVLLFLCSACIAGQKDVYFDENMDFSSIQTIAVLPLKNLTREESASERVRNVLINKFLASGIVYILPPGEVSRGITRMALPTPTDPSSEEAIQLSSILSADTLITGVVKEYGEVRSSTTAANLVSVSLQMIEAKSGKIVWSASSTKGGITFMDRLIGGGGKPMNIVTEQAVNELLKKLFE